MRWEIDNMNFAFEALPEVLKPYKEKIEATLKPTVQMNLKSCDRLSLWQSKVGGQPYLPLDMAYPIDSNGNPLVLLAQFNFTEIPNLPDFPSQGILQFYIATDDLYGMNFDDQQQQSGFSVFYIIDVFKKGSVKDLVYVNDEIQSKILALKNHILKERIIDSLTVGYGKN